MAMHLQGKSVTFTSSISWMLKAFLVYKSRNKLCITHECMWSIDKYNKDNKEEQYPLQILECNVFRQHILIVE